MANYELPNDVIRTFTLVSKDAAGDVVATAPGTSYSAVADDPTAVNVVVAGSNMTMNALKRVQAGVTITIDDSGPLPPFAFLIDIVEDVTPASTGVDTVNVIDVTQPRPAA